jgi:hypothetical protein
MTFAIIRFTREQLPPRNHPKRLHASSGAHATASFLMLPQAMNKPLTRTVTSSWQEPLPQDNWPNSSAALQTVTRYGSRHSPHTPQSSCIATTSSASADTQTRQLCPSFSSNLKSSSHPFATEECYATSLQMHGHQLRLSAGEDIILPKANPIYKGNIMQNTQITEHQRQSGIIKGTDTRYIKRDFYQAWLNIVQQHREGQILLPPQISFLEMVNSLSTAE